MKTIVHKLIRFKKLVILLIAVGYLTATATAQVSGNNGLNFENYILQSGTNLQPGARYLFSNVDNTTDAVVSVDSLVNGATLNSIDDNSNGVGYKQAFQPRVHSGNVVGYSYVVFTISFFVHNTTIPKQMPIIHATALDIDGNNTLKEFAKINVGNGGSYNYLVNTPDISVSIMQPGHFMAENILGIERPGIDTSALANMFTASNTHVSSFSLRYGTFTSEPSTLARQYSLYMKDFRFPSSSLPVKLASFTATLNYTKVNLKWVTSSEINVNHFIVERSIDGINYTSAGVVIAYGSETEKASYHFPDNVAALTVPVVYYRIRSVDFDGSTELSEVRMIKLSSPKTNDIAILTYPNPVTSELRITIPVQWQSKPVLYELLTASGQLVKRIQVANSSQTETIPVHSLAPGMYIARISCEGKMLQQKIVKQ